MVDEKVVVKGSVVKVEYTGSFDDGTVFDSSVGREPLEFEVGAGLVVPGFDTAVLGMSVGGEKTVRLSPSEAYGDRDERLSRTFPRSALPQSPEPVVGMILGVTLPTGQQVPATISKVDSSTVTLDFNHALAGKALTFKIKVVQIL